MDAHNFGTLDIDHMLTRNPFSRCNAPPPPTPRYYRPSICGVPLPAAPAVVLTVLIECAGNSRARLPYATDGLQWDNGAVANIEFGGVWLHDVAPPPPPDAVEIIFDSLDGVFTRSLPVGTPVLLASFANGRRIPTRAVVPGWYGMAHVKWLEAVRYSATPFVGHFQTQRYIYAPGDPVTRLRPKSIITSIQPQSPTVVRGKAWSAHRVERVDLAVDGVWREAEITARTGPFGWVEFTHRLSLPPGLHRIATRATDVTGATQPDVAPCNPLGYGNNAVQSITLDIGGNHAM